MKNPFKRTTEPTRESLPWYIAIRPQPDGTVQSIHPGLSQHDAFEVLRQVTADYEHEIGEQHNG